MNKLWKKIIGSILVVIIGLTAIFGIYVNDYYHASEDAIDCLEDVNSNYSITQKEDEIDFIPYTIKCGFIFYPGAKVEYSSYAPLMEKLANQGILCIIVKMPCNIAFFGENKADSIIEEYNNVKHWYIGGHSLGGVAASSYVAKHTDVYDGLILLASYTTKDLSDSNLNVISIYGSNDEVLNIDSYNENKSNLPPNMIEYVIEGGCHSYFGDYENQDKDGVPTITREQQMDETVDVIVNNIK